MTTNITLREAVSDVHEAAEQTPLAQAMANGTMTEVQYHHYLFNMMLIYDAMERKLHFMPDDVKRVERYKSDLAALGRGAGTPVHATNRYVEYISRLTIPQTWAHVYTHYLGNMYGGQMLGKHMAWQHTHLQFDNIKQCISYVRANLDDVDHEEAKSAFAWTIEVYDELHNAFGRDSTAAKASD